MKYSVYNNIINIDNNTYLYNYFSGALISIDNKTKNKLHGADRSLTFDEKIFSDDEIAVLKKCSFIVSDEVDELKQYLELKQQCINNDKVLRLTIAPTLDCNFCCSYCFEEHRKGIMTKSVQDRICNWIDESLKSGKYTYLNVTWFGGEPLMCVNIVQELSDRFIEICNRYEIKYISAIITNGYLLKSINGANFIERCHISSVQITIDGTENVHNKRRILLGNKKGTYREIIDGINAISNCGCKIKIRINLDRINNQIIKEICFQLEKDILDKKNVFPYIAKLFCMDDLNSGFEDRLLPSEEYVNSAIAFEVLAKKAGFNVERKTLMPKVKIWFCAAPYGHSLVIDPDGDFYYCWNDIGIKEYRIGSLFEEDNKQFEKQRNLWNKYSYEFHNDCLKCKSFVICAGGCAREKVRSDKNYSCDDYSICSDILIKNYIIAQNKMEV